VRGIHRGTVVATGCLAFVFVGGASGVTAMNSEPPADDDEPAIYGEPLQRATDAAIARTGAVDVVGTEVGDEESYYEVEVVLPDGRLVDVQLDLSFAVVSAGQDGDDASSGG
jgi:hypothetical protein